MRTEMDEVKAAGAFLDKYGPSAWRSKVNISKLNMDSVYNCVLGQLYGEYGPQADKFADQYSLEWTAVSDAFADYEDEWREYLRTPVVPRGRFDGTTWAQISGSQRVKAVSQFHHDGVSRVTYLYQGDYFTKTEDDFLARFVPTTTYVQGRLYRGIHKIDGKSAVLVYSDTVHYGGPGFMMVSGNRTTFSEVSWFEKEYGPLTEIKGLRDSDGKSMTVTFQ